MENVKITTDKGKMVIEIDLTQEQGPSKSGKSIVIASTRGNIEAETGIYLSVNCYKKR